MGSGLSVGIEEKLTWIIK